MKNWQNLIEFLDSSVQKWTFPREEAKMLNSSNLNEFDADEQEKFRWEFDALSFWISDGELKPFFTQTSNDGKEVIAFPSFERFSDEAYQYFQIRAIQTKNLILKARYFTILWNAPKPFKRNENGEKAIDVLLSVLSKVVLGATQDWHEELEMFKCAARISAQIKKYRADEIVYISQNWLAQDFEDDKHFKVSLIKFMIELPKIWESKGLIKEHALLMKIMDDFVGKAESFFAKDAGLLGVKIATKLGFDQKIWYNKIGAAYEAFAEERMDDETRIVPLGQLQEAMTFFQKAGNSLKINELGLKYQNLQSELKLSSIQVPIKSETRKFLWDFNDKLSDIVVSRDSKEIFDYLAISADLFPKATHLKENIKNRQPSFEDFAKSMKFDINNNLGTLNQSETEREKEKIFEQYEVYAGMQILPLVSMIISKGILVGKISHFSLIEYLSQHSWLGQELEESNSEGKTRKYCWLGLLAPAFLEYFVQKEASLKGTNIFTNFVLCTDSLTLKFEGILRDFAKRKNATTIKTGREGQIREGFTEDLLELEEVKLFFSEDDLLYFRYVFTSSGKNLRNNIAHCFFRFSSYQEANFLLVLTAILRFAKYRIHSLQPQE